MEIHKAEFLFSLTILGKAKIKNPNVLERTCINKKSTNYGKESSNKSRRCVLCQIDDTHKRYLQYIISDLTCLNSDVIRVFKEKYSLITEPDLADVVKGEVDFYAHCVTSAGVKRGLWEKKGNIKEVGEIKNIIFKSKGDYTRVDIQNDWRVWEINQEEITHVGNLEGENKESYLGLIFHPEDIIHKLKTGIYPGVFAKFE